MQTLAEKLPIFFQNVSPELISESGRRDILAMAGHLPAGLAWSLFGFEVRLAEGDLAADIALSVGLKTPGLGILAGRYDAQCIPSSMMETGEWVKIQQFAKNWENPDSGLRGVLDIVCLEFDMPAPAPERAVPLVFFGVESNGRELREQQGRSETDVLEECAALFGGAPMPEELAERLRTCHAVARDYSLNMSQGGVFQAGLMLSRPGAGLRICVHNIPTQDIPAYLKGVDWPGDYEKLDKALSGPCAIFDRLALALDCAPQGLSPKLGLESYFVDKAQPANEPRWEQVLRQLVEMGLCTPEKLEAMLAFPAKMRLMPIFDSGMESALGEGSGYFRPSSAMRGLHHLKVVVAPDGELSAKAYLWCGYAP